MSTTPITVSSNMFFKGTERWSPKGVCYQPTDGVDPLSDDNYDLIKSLLSPSNNGFSLLGINCLRVYQVDPEASHDKVMGLLAANNIYVLVGAVNGDTAVPGNATSTPAKTVARVEAVADAFCKYDNVLGFSISNELLDGGDSTNYGLIGIVRNVKKQMAAYMASKNYRKIPIGCAMRDVPSYTFPASVAYASGDATDRLDFIGYNCYRWVVPNGATPPNGAELAYYDLYNQFKSFPVPVMLTEIGAACPKGRAWSQVPYILGTKKIETVGPVESCNMSDAISGCFAFRFYDHQAGWGMVTPVSAEKPTIVTGTDYGGYTDLSGIYKGITSFVGTPNGISQMACPEGNPYCPGGSGPSNGGLQTPATMTITNSFANPARNIVVSYSLKSNPGDGDWITAVKIAIGGPAQQFTFPTGTQQVSVAYQDGPTTWYSGCTVKDMSKLKDNETLVANWGGSGGFGPCMIVDNS